MLGKKGNQLINGFINLGKVGLDELVFEFTIFPIGTIVNKNLRKNM